MRYIKKIEPKKKPLQIKVLAFLFVLSLGVSFWASVKYSGKKKNEFPELTLLGQLGSPVVSVDGGFFDSAVVVRLSENEKGQRIYYTTDGSAPTLASKLYRGPFEINDRSRDRNHLSSIPTSPRWVPPLGDVFKGTVLRAIVVDAHNNKGPELKRSFFVFQDKKKYSLPLISIIVDQKDLFGFNRGIYVLGKTYIDKDSYIRKHVSLDLPWWEYPANYMLRGADEERDAFLEFFEPSGRVGFRSNVGLRINGNATRGFPQKSLRVCYRSKYGQSELNYDLFPSNPVKYFSSFVLRNSGNDGTRTMLRDAFMQSLLKDTYVDVQDYRQSVVFINGEYWGIHNIRERFDQNYLANKYSLSPDSVSILELNGTLVYGEKGQEQVFGDLIDFVKRNDLSREDHYRFLQTKMDVRSFQDFIIANVFFCNSDWPNNNVKFWRYTNADGADSLSAKDGRWRWIVFDTDWGFGFNSAGRAEADLLKRATETGNTGLLFRSLLKNEEFKAQFLKRFGELLGSTFDTGQMVEAISAMAAELEPEMQEHIDRWRAIESMRQWKNNVEEMKDFARRRPQLQVDQLNAFFKLKGDKQITLKIASKPH